MAGKKAGFPLLQYNILWDGVVSLQLTQRKHKKGKKTVTKERGLIKCLGTHVKFQLEYHKHLLFIGGSSGIFNIVLLNGMERGFLFIVFSSQSC